MLKKTITYTDYDGNERTEDHYFNLTTAELTKMYSSVNGGMKNYLDQVLSSKDSVKIMDVLDRFIKASYGQKSLDGRRFMKSDEIYREFEESGAYEKFYMELLSSDEAAANFLNQVVPRDIAAQIQQMRAKV